MRKLGAIAFVLASLSTVAASETISIEADRDATLIEEPDGMLANGSGPSLFAGRTNQETGSTRRGLIRFDVAGSLPRNAIVEAVTLTLYQSSGNPAPRTIRLYRVLADWGEGRSFSGGGSGAPSEAGDATWIHTFYDDEVWVHSGGQFLGRASATLEVGDNGSYTWESTNHLVQDVRLWRSAPGRNFGWIVIGDETAPQTVKRFGSRENPDPDRRPVLEVTYRLAGKPAPWPGPRMGEGRR